MKVLKRQISSKDGDGFVQMKTEEAEDMWHAYNLIADGDRVRTSTVRKVCRLLIIHSRCALEVQLYPSHVSTFLPRHHLSSQLCCLACSFRQLVHMLFIQTTGTARRGQPGAFCRNLRPVRGYKHIQHVP